MRGSYLVGGTITLALWSVGVLMFSMAAAYRVADLVVVPGTPVGKRPRPVEIVPHIHGLSPIVRIDPLPLPRRRLTMAR